MAVLSNARSLWISTVLVVICFFFLLTSSNLSYSSSLRIESWTASPKTPEPAQPEDNPATGVYAAGEAIPASAWEHLHPSIEQSVGTHHVYNEGLGGKKPKTQGTTVVAETLEDLEDNCPVCPVLHEDMRSDVKKTRLEDRPLILYAYYESEFARQNLRFFIDHALHSAADFVFILNGETDVDKTIIFRDKEMIKKRDLSNIMIRKRANTCYDLGAHAEVLKGVKGGVGWSNIMGPIRSPNEAPKDGQRPKDKRALKDRYKRYILMNASIRGPFIPLWSNACWSDAYLNKVTDTVKLVGMSYNCHTNRGHVQSMIWATDSVGLNIILTPSGINECFPNMPAAQQGEVRTTQLLRDNGYEVDVFLTVYHSRDKATKNKLATPSAAPHTAENPEKGESYQQPPPNSPASSNLQKRDEAIYRPYDARVDAPAAAQPATSGQKQASLLPSGELAVPGDFYKSCHSEDWLGAGAYFGTFVHPYENLFMKSHRHIEDTVLARLTEWHDGWGYESWGVCV